MLQYSLFDALQMCLIETNKRREEHSCASTNVLIGSKQWSSELWSTCKVFANASFDALVFRLISVENHRFAMVLAVPKYAP